MKLIEIESIKNDLQSALLNKNFDEISMIIGKLDNMIERERKRFSDAGKKTSPEKKKSSQKNFETARKVKSYIQNSEDKEKALREIQIRKLSKTLKQGLLFSEK